MAFDPRLVPEVLWRCPVCGEEESLHVVKKRTGILSSKPAIACRQCNARWEDISGESMTLVEGDEGHQGRRSMAEWSATVYAEKLILNAEKDVDTAVLLRDGEGVIKKVSAAVFPVGRLGGTRSTGRRYLVYTPNFKIPRSSPLPKMQPVDHGELVLTNERIVFDGNRRVLNMELSHLLSAEVRNHFLELGYGDRKYAFHLGKESPFKWKTYIEAAFQAVQEQRRKPRTPRRTRKKATEEKTTEKNAD